MTQQKNGERCPVVEIMMNGSAFWDMERFFCLMISSFRDVIICNIDFVCFLFVLKW